MSSYYKKMVIKPIDVMEQISENKNIPDRPKVNIILAQKHLLRAGLKPGNDWRNEIFKSLNYLFRALYAKWFDMNDPSKTK